MNLKKDIDKVMDSVDVTVDECMKNKILERTTRAGKRKVFYGKTRIVVVAAALVLCISTVTAGAGRISALWNEAVAKISKTNVKTQEKMVQKGYADVRGTEQSDVKETEQSADDVISARNNGISVSLKQTLADRYGIRIYLDVKSTNGLKLTGNRLFEDNDIYFDGKKIGINEGAGFVEDQYKISDYEHIYELYSIYNKATDIEGKEIGIHLGNLIGGEKKLDDDVLVSGNWDLHWVAKSSTESKKIPLSGSYQLKGTVAGKTRYTECRLKTFEISPLSFRLTYECEDWNHISKELEYSAIPLKVVMKDGTVYARGTKDKVDEDHVLGGAGSNTDTEELSFFDEYVLDIDNIDYVEIAGTRYDL